MRYLPLFFLIIVLVGCQSDPALVLPPAAVPTHAPTITASQSPIIPTTTQNPPTLIPETRTPTLSVTQTVEPVATRTQEPQPVDPVQPLPIASASPYPVEEPDLSVEPIWSYRVVGEYPHDSSAFTQGLVIEGDLRTYLEGTGRDSSLRRVNLKSGEIEQLRALPEGYFGEGITKFEDRIFQLTWQSQEGFIYDSESFEQIGEFYYPHQGWGLTHDGRKLIVSDGTDVIRFWDPVTFQEMRQIEVLSVNGPVTSLNELEYVNGEIWANIWHTDFIARISPEDGRVLGWIDLTGILSPDLRSAPETVLNGIAYDENSGRLFVTGKYWPTLFEIEVFDSGNS